MVEGDVALTQQHKPVGSRGEPWVEKWYSAYSAVGLYKRTWHAEHFIKILTTIILEARTKAPLRLLPHT